MRSSNEGASNERPVHEVCVDGFWMGKYEVTQAQYETVMGTNPSRFKGPDQPVENVSWEDAQMFCEQLTKMAKENIEARESMSDKKYDKLVMSQLEAAAAKQE